MNFKKNATFELEIKNSRCRKNSKNTTIRPENGTISSRIIKYGKWYDLKELKSDNNAKR
jgi:hypothetical protein